jgi:uncharacterized OB-fold protein
MGGWTKPVPVISGETRPFWEACQRGQYLVQKCEDCGRAQAYYRGSCAFCWSPNVRDVVASGRGTVWTYTVTYENRTPGFREDAPYILAVIELEEGVQVLGNIVECAIDRVGIGLAVRATFVDAGGTPVPMFAPLDPGEATGGV